MYTLEVYYSAVKQYLIIIKKKLNASVFLFCKMHPINAQFSYIVVRERPIDLKLNINMKTISENL